MAKAEEAGKEQPKTNWSIIKDYAISSTSPYFQLLYESRDPKLTKKATIEELFSRVFKSIRSIRLVDYFNYTDQHDLTPFVPFTFSAEGRWKAYEALDFATDSRI